MCRWVILVQWDLLIGGFVVLRALTDMYLWCYLNTWLGVKLNISLPYSIYFLLACDDECSGLLISDMDRLYRVIADVTLTTPLPPPYKLLYRFENMTEELKVILSVITSDIICKCFNSVHPHQALIVFFPTLHNKCARFLILAHYYPCYNLHDTLFLFLHSIILNWPKKHYVTGTLALNCFQCHIYRFLYR